MRYISNTPAQQKEMLGVIGAASIEDLLVRIPAKARLSRPLNLPAAMAEMDLVRHLRGLAGPERERGGLRLLPRRRLLRPLDAEPDQPPDLARGVLHRLHAVSARGEPGDAPDDLRVPDHDRRAHRDGRRQRLALRRRVRAGRGRADGACGDGPGRHRPLPGREPALSPGRGDVRRGAEPSHHIGPARRWDHRPRRAREGRHGHDRRRRRAVPELLRLPRGRRGRPPRSPTPPAPC